MGLRFLEEMRFPPPFSFAQKRHVQKKRPGHLPPDLKYTRRKRKLRKRLGRRGKVGVAMRDYQVEVVRRGKILIRADSVEEATLMAARFGYHSFEWDDKYEIHAEVAKMPRDKAADRLSGHGKGFRPTQKKKKRSRKYYPDEFPEEIPF